MWNKKYFHIIKDVLTGANQKYRYPGEILERCLIDFPEEKEIVLDGFLAFMDILKNRKLLVEKEDNFNSNQISSFVNAIGNYKGEMMRFLLTGEVAGVIPEYLNNTEDYLFLGEYIKCLVANNISAEDVTSLTREFFKVISLMRQSHYVGTGLETIVSVAKHSHAVELMPREDRKYFTLIKKATENVYSGEDINKLTSMGYTELQSRKLNVLNIPDLIAGRQDRAWYNFLYLAFFGSEVLSDTDKDMIKQKVVSNDYNNWKLDRKINGENRMLVALSVGTLNEDSVNASFALSVLEEFYFLANELSFTGKVFQSLTKEQKEKCYEECLNRSFNNEKLLFAKKYFYDNYGVKALSKIRSSRYRFLLENNIYTVDEFDSQYIDMNNLVEDSFKHISKLSLEVLEKYALRAPNLFKECWHNNYYRGIPAGIFLIKGENLTDEQSIRLYRIKEEYFFKCAPRLYKPFLFSVIKETRTLVHSKNEWLELLSYIERTGCDILEYKKLFLSDNEYEAIIKERQEKENQEKYEAIIQSIHNAKSGKDIEWFKIPKTMPELKKAACMKIIELKDFSDEYRILQSYYEGILTDDELLIFLKGKKEYVNKKED